MTLSVLSLGPLPSLPTHAAPTYTSDPHVPRPPSSSRPHHMQTQHRIRQHAPPRGVNNLLLAASVHEREREFVREITSARNRSSVVGDRYARDAAIFHHAFSPALPLGGAGALTKLTELPAVRSPRRKHQQQTLDRRPELAIAAPYAFAAVPVQVAGAQGVGSSAAKSLLEARTLIRRNALAPPISHDPAAIPRASGVDLPPKFDL